MLTNLGVAFRGLARLRFETCSSFDYPATYSCYWLLVLTVSASYSVHLYYEIPESLVGGVFLLALFFFVRLGEVAKVYDQSGQDLPASPDSRRIDLHWRS